MGKTVTRQKHRGSSNNTAQKNERTKNNETSPHSALLRVQQPHVAAPEDLLTLQNTVGNRAVDDIRPQTQTPNASPPSLANLLNHLQINGPVIQRNDDQATNVFAERNYARITNEQQRQIDSFASRAQTMIAPWGECRRSVSGTGGMDHATYMSTLLQIKRQLSSAYNQFTRNFGETVTTQPAVNAPGGVLMPPSHRHQVSFHDHPLAPVELARQLNQGFFPQYLREIQVLHGLDGATLVSYERLMERHAGMSFPHFPHVYRLRTIIGIEGGAGEVVTAGAFIRAFVIEYSNELGMSWRVNSYGAALKAGGGISTSPVEANIDTSLGSNEINAGTARELRYYPPSYFSVNMVTAVGSGGSLGGGRAISQLNFGDVNFDTSGWTLRFGTSVAGELGGDVAMGLFTGGRPYDVQDLAESQAAQLQSRGARWIPVIAGRCHFRTEEARLDSDDEASLDRVVEAIVRHERFYPGDIFRITVKGFASQRWTTPTASAQEYGVDTSDIEQESTTRGERESLTAERLNEELALARARVTGNELANRISAQAAQFSAGVLERSDLRAREFEVIHVDDPDADTNAATNRYVQIAVYYNNSPEGNIRYNPSAT